VRPIARAVTGISTGLSLSQAVRALFSANGGDFTGTMLDFTDSTALWQDTGATTQAGDGDTLARVDDQSGEGNNATQATAAERPAVTTDAFGTLVASPDGADDNMDLPDGVLGDGTDHVHVFAAYALDNANSDTSPCVVGGTTNPPNYGLISSHVSTDGQPQFAYSDSATSNTEEAIYSRALTDHETVVRSDLFDPGASAVIRINGAEVARDESVYAATDDPGVATLFGRTTTANLAGTCHGIVVLTGSRAMTSAEIATVETWLASLTGDALLTAEADTVLQRLFTPATDLNVNDGFSSDDWTDNSAGASSITLNAGSDITFNVVSTDAAIADRTFPVRVGYRYTITSTADAGVTVSADEATAGGSTYGAGGSITFTAETETVYVRASTTTDGDQVTSLSLTEIAATGEWWDLLDTTKLYSDDGSTQAVANDPVFRVDGKGSATYPLKQTTAGSRPVLDATGTFVEFDGVDDFFEAVDPDDDLAITGDLTIVYAGKETSISDGALYIASSGDREDELAWGFRESGGGMGFVVGDGASLETWTTDTTPISAGTDSVYSARREGGDVVQAIDVTDVSADTLNLTEDAGASPETVVGRRASSDSLYFDGAIKQLLIADRALSTGLLLHMERAIQEKIA